ncbi:AraC family transcriptional regulator [Rhodovibrionaceae bacterium A322]
MNKNDLITDLCSTLRLRARLYFEAEFRGQVAVELQSEKRHIRFHLVRQGHCWVALPGQDAQRLEEGDIVMIPDGAGQILSTAPDLDPVTLSDLLAADALKDNLLRGGEGPIRCRMVCGFCQLDEALLHPLLQSLPDLLIIRQQELGKEPWTAAALRLLSLESALIGDGSGATLPRLLEILFIQTLRRLTTAEADHLFPGNRQPGFTAALMDPQISKALQAIHQTPEKPWRMEDLAREAGMSRARFAERFTRLVGKPPIGYLTDWRLLKARTLLLQSNLDMAEVAARSGYASLPSFSSRFKKVFGQGPGAFRREALGGTLR